jgi:DNA-binding XRE family transcriptional regulator
MWYHLTPMTPIGTIGLLVYFHIASCGDTWSKFMEFRKKLDLACRSRDLDRNAILKALNGMGDPRLAASKATVGRWFNGQSEPSIRQGIFISRLFGTTVEFLFDEEHKIEGTGNSEATTLTSQEKVVIALARHLGIATALDRLAQVSRVSS